MIDYVVAGFVGAFTALAVLAETQHQSRSLRYLIAFVVGLVAAVVLGLCSQWLATHVLGKV